MAVENQGGARRATSSKRTTSKSNGATSASRGRSSGSSNGASASRGSGSSKAKASGASAAKKSGSSAAKKSSGSARRSSSSANKGRARSASSASTPVAAAAERVEGLFNSRASRGSSNGSRLLKTVIDRAAVPIATATVGVAGGIVLGRTKLQRSRKALGMTVPQPPRKVELRGLGQQIGEAGRQFAKLAQEVNAVRAKAEKVGRAIS